MFNAFSEPGRTILPRAKKRPMVGTSTFLSIEYLVIHDKIKRIARIKWFRTAESPVIRIGSLKGTWEKRGAVESGEV